jgi:hypothetical protein
VTLPTNLEQCFTELDKILSKREIEDIKKGGEDNLSLYHHGLGRYLRNTWELWHPDVNDGGTLSEWFNNIGIKHPDDMSGIILTSYYRHLNSLPILLDEQVKFYQDFWKMSEATGGNYTVVMNGTKITSITAKLPE